MYEDYSRHAMRPELLAALVHGPRRVAVETEVAWPATAFFDVCEVHLDRARFWKLLGPRSEVFVIWWVQRGE